MWSVVLPAGLVKVRTVVSSHLYTVGPVNIGKCPEMSGASEFGVNGALLVCKSDLPESGLRTLALFAYGHLLEIVFRSHQTHLDRGHIAYFFSNANQHQNKRVEAEAARWVSEHQRIHVPSLFSYRVSISDETS